MPVHRRTDSQTSMGHVRSNLRGRMQVTTKLLLWLGLALCLSSPALAQTSADPAALISDFRVQHREGRVKSDATLKRIAQDQANAMASRGVMEHDVLGSFSSRVAPANAGRAAENIAYGYDSFPKTLDQWINSSSHRKNLLMHEGERVGVASAKSSANGRTYWAMVIAGGYEKPKPANTKGAKARTAEAKPKARAAQACRLKLLGLCL
jgi:uncharacterized protein YkwD